ncbi:ubiquinol oxidase subunit II [Candidatus Saccharibacteria bacterium]|nr:ubiquinol oxidase subunit II [Candidatus Saccharibacteria bacterium]
MSGKSKLAVLALAILGLVSITVIYLQNVNIPLLDPDGPIGQKERNLIVLAVALSLIVVIPVYFMLVYFAWNYREGNKKARYDPHFDHSRLIESVWWGVPLVIITILAIATWRGSHELDPFRPLQADTRPLNIQVVALQWKWLFIYPDYNIATVNLVQFPERTPIAFDVTADAPMNSFWIPQLGGQIYAMSGMSTKVHLMANNVGSYQGSSANISGEGFADMTFVANSVSAADFDKWIKLVGQYRNWLTMDVYGQLASPSRGVPISYYSSVEKDLYHLIFSKYTQPSRYGLGAPI